MPSHSTAYLLIVKSDRIPMALNSFRAIQAVTRNISKAFDEVWQGPLPKLVIFDFNSAFLSNRQFSIFLDSNPSREYPINVSAPQGFILGPAVFLLCIDNLPDYVMCNIIFYADGNTPYSTFNWPFDKG